jgi:hypothetical protein
MGSGDYKIENFYEPGYSSFKPNESGPYLKKQGLISVKDMGMTTNPMVANQISELAQKLSPGTSVIEIGTIQPKHWESIPIQQFEEIRQKAKLADAKITMHAPIVGVDPAGFGQQGWNAEQRELVERQLIDVVDKAAIINKKDNLPITIHASNFQGSTFKMGKDNKPIYEQMLVVDKKTGQATQMKEEIMYSPGDLRGKPMTPEEGLISANNSQWRNEVDAVIFKNEAAQKTLMEIAPVGTEIYHGVNTGQIDQNNLTPTQRDVYLAMQNADTHLHDAKLGMDTLFNKAWEYASGTEEEKKKKREVLTQLSNQYVVDSGNLTEEFVKNSKLSEDQLKKIAEKRPDLKSQFQAVQNLTNSLKEGALRVNGEVKTLNPEMFQRYEEFAIDKSKETFANVAMHAYEKYGKGAPAISIENMQQGMGFSNMKDLKNLTDSSRKEFVNKLVEEKKVSPSEANKIAEKIIGVTFDVGHLNISRSHGFTEKALIKEAEAIAKHVNKVHITDNFGFDDSHLPIGMGNVPVEEMLKALGKSGEQAFKINEVGGWFEHFKTNPFPQLLEAAGSPLYSSGQGPYWQQMGGFQQSYIEGYGMLLPQQHYQMFGAGFSQLPANLGGSTQQQGGGRMGGGGV